MLRFNPVVRRSLALLIYLLASMGQSNVAVAAVDDPITCSSTDVNNYNTIAIRQLIFRENNTQNQCAATGFTDCSATATADSWALCSDVPGGTMKVRFENQARFTNRELNGAPIPIDTNVETAVGSNTITYTDTTDGEDRTVTFVTSADRLTFATTTAFSVTSITNTAPVITSNGGGAAAAVNAAENQTGVTDVDSTDDTDSEGAGLTYSLTTTGGGGADNGFVDIDANSGILTFSAAPSFDNPQDAGGNNVYDVQVTVTDNGSLTDVQDIAVTVTDVDTIAPTVSILNAPSSHDGSTPFIVTIEYSEDVTGFVVGDVTVGNGTVASLTPVDGNTYTVGITPSGPLDVTVDVAANVAQDALANMNTAATQVTIGGTVVQQTVQLIGSFAQNRGNLIMQNRPNLTRRIDRLNGHDTNNGGISGFGVSIVSGHLPFSAKIGTQRSSFSYSLRQSQAEATETRVRANPASVLSYVGTTRLTRSLTALASTSVAQRSFFSLLSASPFTNSGHSDSTDAVVDTDTDSHVVVSLEGNVDGETLNTPAGEEVASEEITPVERFDVWIEGNYSQYRGFGGNGNFTLGHVGGDYLVNSDLLLGLSVQLDWTTYTQDSGGKIDGFGFMFGPYLTAKLSERFYLDAATSWGRSDNSASPLGTFNDKFDAERWLATGAIIGDFHYQGFNVRPEARLSYFREVTVSYTNSLLNAIPSLTYEVGTFDFGPMVSTKLTLSETLTLTPHVTAQGVWTFGSSNSAVQITGNPSTQSGEGIRAIQKAGLALANSNGMSLTLGGSFDGLGQDNYEAWSVNGGMRIKW